MPKVPDSIKKKLTPIPPDDPSGDWEEQSIEIILSIKDRETGEERYHSPTKVRAKCLGYFAVVEVKDYDFWVGNKIIRTADGYSLTHIATGLFITILPTEREAMLAGEKLMQEYPLVFRLDEVDELLEETPEELKDWARECKAQFKLLPIPIVD